MTSYATLEDYEERYGEVQPEDVDKITLLLEDATAIIQANGGETDPTDATLRAYIAVTCAMVHRVVISPAWATSGVTQHTQTAGPFTESYSFGNPNGDLFLTANERKTLGLTKMQIGTIPPINHYKDGI